MLNDSIPCCPSSSDNETIGAVEMAALREEFAGEGISELVEIFEQEAPAVVARIAAAIAGADADAVRRGAHQLKGASANFGARPLAALCEKMESAARVGNIAPAAALSSLIRAEIQRVRAALARDASYQSPV